jgi:hypothetical protein
MKSLTTFTLLVAMGISGCAAPTDRFSAGEDADKLTAAIACRGADTGLVMAGSQPPDPSVMPAVIETMEKIGATGLIVGEFGGLVFLGALGKTQPNWKADGFFDAVGAIWSGH